VADGGLPTSLELRVVTPVGELVNCQADEVQAPGVDGYFGVLPGHTPFLTALGMGEISYRQGDSRHFLTCFGGFCEVLPDRVTVLADVGELAESIDVERAEKRRDESSARLRALTEEEGYAEALRSHQRNLTRLAVARKRR
jgi:F-type H+-transporting ATPase subunit epsilon